MTSSENTAGAAVTPQDLAAVTQDQALELMRQNVTSGDGPVTNLPQPPEATTAP
jgi:hypothetical protein